MADEPTPTPTDTPTSPSEPAAPAAPAPEDKGTPPAGDPPAAPAEEDTTVLGGKADGDTPAEEAPPGAPEKYELAMEGVELDAAMVAEAEPILRELNLTNDAANKLVPMAAKLVTNAQDKTLQLLADAGAQQKKDWLDAYHADPEIGGAKRQETEHLAAKGLDALGYTDDHPFRKALTESGFGNHPDMIRAFRRVGEMVGEDGSFVRSDTAAKSDTPTEKRWYGKQGAE